MAGLRITVPGTFTATTAKKYIVDPRLSDGSLMLFAPRHTLGGFDGVPAPGGKVPNVAWDKANLIVDGSPGESGLAIPFVSTDALPSVSFPKIERSGKGGLHLIRSQANDVAGKTAALDFPPAIKAYILAHLDHAYFLSAWQYFTRPFTTAGSPYPGISLIGNNTSNCIGGFAPNSVAPIGAAAKTVSVITGANGLTAGHSLMQVGVTGKTGTVTAIGATAYIFGGQGGPFSGLHVGGSQILEELYLEDVTVGAAGLGISVAQRMSDLATLDAQMHAAAVATGGSLDGETYTDPGGYP